MSSNLAKYPFEPYWPEKKLRILVTGAGGKSVEFAVLTHLSSLAKALAAQSPEAPPIAQFAFKGQP